MCDELGQRVEAQGLLVSSRVRHWVAPRGNSFMTGYGCGKWAGGCHIKALGLLELQGLGLSSS